MKTAKERLQAKVDTINRALGASIKVDLCEQGWALLPGKEEDNVLYGRILEFYIRHDTSYMFGYLYQVLCGMHAMAAKFRADALNKYNETNNLIMEALE